MGSPSEMRNKNASFNMSLQNSTLPQSGALNENGVMDYKYKYPYTH